MEYPVVTIVVVQRERFSHNDQSLESIYKNTSFPFKLIYIDSHSPPRVKRYLEAQAAEKNFRLIHTDQFLTPNEARNIGQAEVDTKYVVFINNDLLVAPDWLDKLVECSEETGAWVVGPIYLEDNLEDGIIHMAGGEAHFKQEQGRRSFHGDYKFSRLKLSEVRPQLKREPTEAIKLHCALARNDIFVTLGPLDEKFMTLSEHQDFCLAVRAAGGSVYLEPDALVSFFISSPLTWSDLPYFYQRWSEVRNQQTMHHMREKWNLPVDDYFINLMLKFSKKHRMKFIRLWFPWQLHRLGRIISYPLVFLIDILLSVVFTRNSACSGHR